MKHAHQPRLRRTRFWTAISACLAVLLGLLAFNVPNGHAQRSDRNYDDRYDERDYDRRRNQDRYDDRAYDDRRRGDVYDSDRPGGRYDSRSSHCRKLERELASDWVRGRANNNALPELNQKIRAQDKAFNKLQNRADRSNCYEDMFIFGRSVRRTRRCLAIDKDIRKAKRELARLRQERNSIRDSRTDGTRRNRLINELARNGCGEQYTYESRRNRNNWSGGLFGDIFGNQTTRRPRRDRNFSTRIEPYATYRTMCVRMCDGFYYPVSFSTLPVNFNKDSDACQNECAAPAQLYVYRNPGGEVEQMISPAGRPYDELKNAWRFRKEYIKGCSCKSSEYSEEDIAAFEAGNDKKKPSGKRGAASQPDKRSTASAKREKARTIEDLIR